MSKPIFYKITIKGNLGGECCLIAEIISHKTHGYNFKSGSWGLYPNKNEKSQKAIFLEIRQQRKRRHNVLNISRVIKMEKNNG